MARPSAAASRRGASSLAAVAYQNSPSAVVPSALAASHRSAAAHRGPSTSPCRRPGGPLARRHAGAARRVDAPHPAPAGARPERVAQQVALHAGGHHGAAPVEDGGHGQARRLAALRRPHDHERLGGLRCHQQGPRPTGDGAEEEASRGRKVCPHEQRAQVAPPRPASTTPTGAVARPV